MEMGGAGAGAAPPPATPRSAANRILAGMDAAWHLPRYAGAAEVADAGACAGAPQRPGPEERAWPLSRKSPSLQESRGILSRRRQLFHSNVFQRKPRGRSPTRKYVGARRAEHERRIEDQVAHLESKLRAILAEQDASDLVSYPLRGPGGAGAEESVGSSAHLGGEGEGPAAPATPAAREGEGNGAAAGPGRKQGGRRRPALRVFEDSGPPAKGKAKGGAPGRERGAESAAERSRRKAEARRELRTCFSNFEGRIDGLLKKLEAQVPR